MKQRITIFTLACFVFSIFLQAGPAMAQEPDLANLVRALQKQMSDLQAIVQAQNSELQVLKADIKMSPSGVEAAQNPPMTEAEFKDHLHKATGGADKWLDGLKFKGDVRMRFEPTSNSRATASDVNRFRFRLRFGFEKIFNEEWKAGFRLASGGTTDPTSTNQTFDNAFANKTITIDRAYGIYTPQWALRGPINNVEIGVGKVENPLSDVHSWLVWDGDVTPEGLYEKASVRLLETKHVTTDLECLGTQFIINEGNGNSADAELFGFSFGLRNKFTHEKLKHPIEFRTYANYELSRDFANVAQNGLLGGVNTRNNYFTNGNNTGDLGVLSFYHELGWKIDPLPKFKLFFEHGQNTDAHMSKDQYRHLWVAGAKIGKAKKKGDWELSYTYGWLEANSTFSVWADSDFGFTDRRGSVFKAGYAVTDFLTLNGSAFFTNAIDTSARGDNDQRLFQVDLVWKF